MTDPHTILGIPPDASAEIIRARYLALVRQFPPDREPAKFTEIHRAYEQMRDPVARIEQQLLDLRSTLTFDDLLAGTASNVRARRLPSEVLLSLGRN